MQEKVIVAALSTFRGNEWRVIAFESSEKSMPPRVSLQEKLKNPDFVSHQTTDQNTGDKLALVLISFHGVLQPYLVSRTSKIWNEERKSSSTSAVLPTEDDSSLTTLSSLRQYSKKFLMNDPLKMNGLHYITSRIFSRN